MTPLLSVEQWPDTAYRAAVRREHDGLAADTHLALLAPPDGKRCRGYVKHFNNPAHHRGLFNEWFCHHLLQALGVPQPRCAVMRAPCLATGQLGWAFVSCEASPVHHGTPKQIYRTADLAGLKQLAGRLLACELLPLLIAADQLLANEDRNLGNLVFVGKNTFVAIDHSHALHGPGWAAGDMWFTQQAVGSKLLQFIEDFAGPLPTHHANAIVAAADVVQEQYFLRQDELRTMLNTAGNADTAAAMDMVWWRCVALGQWFRMAMRAI